MRNASPHRGGLGSNPGSNDMGDDLMAKALERSTIAQALKAARASLAEPSRPFTPLDRSLFQMADSGGGSRPSSGYSVDQLSFVKDTFGGRGELSRSGSGRYESIAEEADEGAYRREGGADVLRFEEEGSARPSPQDSEVGDDSSDGEELTPMVGTNSRSLGSASVARPPRPPGAGAYPSSLGSTSRGSAGYPDAIGASASDASPKHRSSARSSSGRRKRDKASPSPAAGERSSSGRRKHSDDQQPSGASGSTPPGTPHKSRGSKNSADDWDSACEAVIAKLQALAESEEKKKTSAETLLEMSERVLELAMDIKAGKGSKSQQTAPTLLRAVLGLLDLKDTKCLFKLSRCALLLLREEAAIRGVPTSGVQAAYLNVAKVLFKCSKTEGHDADFAKEGLLQPLLEVLQTEGEQCDSDDLKVYVVGVLKNVSINEGNQKLLVKEGAIGTLFSLAKSEQLTGASKEAQLLIQITATLRSLAGYGYKQFIADERLSAMTRMMSLFPSNLELLTNISRTLAKLTLHNSACEAYVKNDAHIRQIAKTLSTHADHAPLALRLSFVLGNLTAKSDKLRVTFAFHCEGTSLAPQLLAKYWQKERQLARISVDKGQNKAAGLQEIEEVLVKLVRLVANIAISSSAGSTLASSSAVVDPLLDMLGAKRIADSEELVLNVVAAITNLLFYDVPSNLLFQEDNKHLLCRLFRPLLLESYNVEALIETARAFGNLSRHADARQCMADIRLDEILIILLDHDDRDLVFYVCGALVNLAADPACTDRLTNHCPTVQKLGKLLGDAPPDDVALLLVAVKVLTNLSLDPGAAWPTGTEDVREALLMLTQDGVLPGGDDDTDKQQFLELSHHLLGRLPPPSPSALAEAKANAAALATSKASAVAEDTAKTGGETKSELVCQAAGCGRKFSSKAKLDAHVDRRHPEFCPPAA